MLALAWMAGRINPFCAGLIVLQLVPALLRETNAGDYIMSPITKPHHLFNISQRLQFSFAPVPGLVTPI